MPTKTPKSNIPSDWIIFSRSYLYLARLGCQEVLEQKHNFLSLDKKIYQRDLFISILFNVKHGIEIFTKTSEILLSEEFKKNNRGHNISELFKMLNKKIKSRESVIVGVIKEKFKINPEDECLQSVNSILDSHSISDLLDNIEKLVLKYYHCEVFQKRMKKNFVIEDCTNTAFRYPENDLKVKPDYKLILDEVTQKDIEEIMVDVESILSNFVVLGFILEIYKEHEN